MIWAEKIPQQYKRTMSDGAKKCPYCKAQWNWSINRGATYCQQGFVNIKCNKCKQVFTWKGGRI